MQYMCPNTSDFSHKIGCVLELVLYCILVSVRYACTGGCVVFCGHVLTCTGLIYCNACNRIEQLEQVPLFRLSVSTHSWDGNLMVSSLYPYVFRGSY